MGPAQQYITHSLSEDTITKLVQAWTNSNGVQKQAWLLQQEEYNRIRAVKQWLKDQEAAALRQKEEAEAEAEAEDITLRKKKPKMNDLNPQNQLVTPLSPTHLSMPWQSWAVPNGLNYSTSFPRPAISLLKHIWLLQFPLLCVLLVITFTHPSNPLESFLSTWTISHYLWHICWFILPFVLCFTFWTLFPDYITHPNFPYKQQTQLPVHTTCSYLLISNKHILNHKSSEPL